MSPRDPLQLAEPSSGAYWQPVHECIKTDTFRARAGRGVHSAPEGRTWEGGQLGAGEPGERFTQGRPWQRVW